MKTYNRVCLYTSNALLALCSVFMAVLLCCSALQIFSRYVLNDTFTWTEECARYCYIWLDLLGASVLVYKDGHAVVDLLSKLPRGTFKRIYDSVIYLALGYVGVIFAVFGLKLADATWFQTSSALKLPMGLVYSSLWISGFFMCFFVVNRILNLWLAVPCGQKEA